ncbi:SulP family inorganic anion transporter [Defluviimonas sp. WL0002]|uniref:SulP family inorganic anion transporter n=1 Tax=Albidovulum marisflavi TaxID=2984159 RepID=A0ABT2ZFM1_9RHOB|nr:SulP family inorganic anion transporter [Defluviimonas sp. WL0002]MCV2869838.1 SulP family inorganic anion transporter [Defluviimonas sp. WL0002]
MHPELVVTLRSYSRALFLSDLVAGITVAMVALPLSLAIAIASGATPAQGLVTAIIGGFLISALGGSRVQIGGPTGAFIVVVYAVIAQHGYDGLVLATLMAGVLLLAAAALRLGSLIEYIPEAVVNGFTMGIAAIIATSQLKDFLGLTTGAVPADFLEKLPVLWDARASLSVSAVGLGLATVVLIVVFRRAAPRAPGLIVAVALTSGVAAYFDLPVETIGNRFGALPQSLPIPEIPHISVERIASLLPSAFVIAFLAGVESLLSAMVADRMTNARHRPNAEVLAQGAANIGSALMGGLPATGAIARTATNVRAGGRTPVAGIIHAATLLAFMYLAAPLASYLAMPALAALLMLTAWNMSEPQHWGRYMRARRSDRIMLLLTLVLTLVADLTVAIGVGVAVGLALRLRRRNVPPADWETPER